MRVIRDESPQETQVDPLLDMVFHFVMSAGWMEKCEDNNLKPFYDYKLEFLYEQNRVLCGSRVIISPVLREKIMWELPGYTQAHVG